MTTPNQTIEYDMWNLAREAGAMAEKLNDPDNFGPLTDQQTEDIHMHILRFASIVDTVACCAKELAALPWIETGQKKLESMDKDQLDKWVAQIQEYGCE